MNKKLLIALITLFAIKLNAQNPGLVISEVLANPAGADSCKEYVELLATQNITFSNTPYTIIVTNNGAATAQGWINGGAITYAFEVSTGSVAAGSVVYVGGSCMAPSGQQLRVLNSKYVGGDGGIGNIVASGNGVFGNGGANADGVGVFNLPVASINANSVPVDAIFFGTGIGTASVTGGITGYQLPVNDFYSGGKLQGSSYYAPDPASDILVTATGIYNTTFNTWSQPRTITTGTTMTNVVSSVSLSSMSTSIATISFVSNDSTVVESSSTATMYLKLTTASAFSSAVTVSVSVLSNASASDYSMAVTTITFAANAPVNSAAPLVISINNDAIVESAEYVVLRLVNPSGAIVGGTTQCTFFIKDDDKVIPSASNAINLNLLSSFSNTVTGLNSAEIVAHDPTTQRLYIANSIAGKLDIVDFVNPSNPTLLFSIPITNYGNINSVAVKNGTVACAIENSSLAIGGTNPQDSGKVVFFDKNGTFLKSVKVGMMPDMITFNNAGTKVITPNEGEPNATYTQDPDGSVSIIDISGGISALTQSNVAHVTFTVYNGQEPALKAQGIRIYGLGASASKDFEPEYVAVAKDDSKIWVTLQENNAIVEIDMNTYAINYIKSLGTKDHSLLNNGIDASNITKGVNISNFPIKGMYLPDAITSYSIGGVNYLITANEGDARAYNGFSEEVRLGAASVTLDPIMFPKASEIKNNSFLGRLNITNKSGDIDGDGDLDTVYCYGSRSFSIWNATTGNLVYDSKDDLEQITAAGSFSNVFNASNSGTAIKKDRSDDKGPEPEGVTIGVIGASTYAFIALERIGGVMVYDVTNPNAPVYVTYVNNLTTPTGPDRGAEGLIFIHQSQSPNGQHIVIAANEISSTLSIWGIAGCLSPISTSLSVANGTVNCPNVSVLSVASTTNNYQWLLNGSNIAGANSSTYSPVTSGNYAVSITGGTNCAATSLSQSIAVNAAPALTVSGTSSVCSGSSLSQTVTGASTYLWANNGFTTSVVSLTPSVTTNYTITGTGSNSCTSNIVKTITVTPLPTVSVATSSSLICVGQAASLTASGATTYSWNTGAGTSIIVINPTVTTSYTVTGNNNGCSNGMAFTQNVSACTDIAKIELAKNETVMYPNPASAQITLLFESEGAVEVVIYNTLGQIAKIESKYISGTIMDLLSLSKGIYTVCVQNGNQRFTKKLIIN